MKVLCYTKKAFYTFFTEKCFASDSIFFAPDQHFRTSRVVRYRSPSPQKKISAKNPRNKKNSGKPMFRGIFFSSEFSALTRLLKVGFARYIFGHYYLQIMTFVEDFYNICKKNLSLDYCLEIVVAKKCGRNGPRTDHYL